MHLSSALRKAYTQDTLSALEAQRLAQFIAWGPVVFQASRAMVRLGILSCLSDSKDGLTREEIVQQTGLSDYAVKCLLEASLSIGTIPSLSEIERASFPVLATAIASHSTKVVKNFVFISVSIFLFSLQLVYICFHFNNLQNIFV